MYLSITGYAAYAAVKVTAAIYQRKGRMIGKPLKGVEMRRTHNMQSRNQGDAKHTHNVAFEAKHRENQCVFENFVNGKIKGNQQQIDVKTH